MDCGGLRFLVASRGVICGARRTAVAASSPNAASARSRSTTSALGGEQLVAAQAEPIDQAVDVEVGAAWCRRASAAARWSFEEP